MSGQESRLVTVDVKESGFQGISKFERSAVSPLIELRMKLRKLACNLKVCRGHDVRL